MTLNWDEIRAEIKIGIMEQHDLIQGALGHFTDNANLIIDEDKPLTKHKLAICDKMIATFKTIERGFMPNITKEQVVRWIGETVEQADLDGSEYPGFVILQKEDLHKLCCACWDAGELIFNPDDFQKVIEMFKELGE